MIEQRGRICSELSDCVGGVDAGDGEKEEEVSSTDWTRGNSEEVGGGWSWS